MGIFEILIIGIGLSMDAFAIAVCKGLSMSRINIKHAVIIGLYFGIAQAVMPIIGYYLGVGFKNYIVSFDHWIAFVLLLFIGGKMVLDAIKERKEGECECCGNNPLGVPFREIFPMAVATSVDALAVGVSFAFLGTNIWLSASVIGITTFTLSVIGVGIGCFFGSRWKFISQLSGGIMLVLIGTKILIEHLFE